MATMSMARAGSASVRQPSSGVMMMGVFIHPSHGVQLDMPSSAPSTPMPFVNPFKSAEEALPSHLNDLTLSASSSSLSSSPVDSEVSEIDYFSSRLSSHRDSDSSFASSASSNSRLSCSSADTSACSTPTTESPYPTKAPMSRTPSLYSESSACPSPSFPASFAFNSFGAPQSRPSSRPSSPGRASPYARHGGGSSMQRAVSSPVETQRALDLRTRAMVSATEALESQAGRMARSRSVVGLPGLGLGLGGASSSMSRSVGSRSPALSCPSPLVTPFEEGWGSALPPREYAAPEMVPFPYNIAVTPTSPHRLARSHSIGGSSENRAPNSFVPGHRNSVPTIPTSSRPRRGTLNLAPLTPILPSAELFPHTEEASVESFAQAVEDNSLRKSPQKPSFHRGVTY